MTWRMRLETIPHSIHRRFDARQYDLAWLIVVIIGRYEIFSHNVIVDTAHLKLRKEYELYPILLQLSQPNIPSRRIVRIPKITYPAYTKKLELSQFSLKISCIISGTIFRRFPKTVQANNQTFRVANGATDTKAGYHIVSSSDYAALWSSGLCLDPRPRKMSMALSTVVTRKASL